MFRSPKNNKDKQEETYEKERSQLSNDMFLRTAFLQLQLVRFIDETKLKHPPNLMLRHSNLIEHHHSITYEINKMVKESDTQEKREHFLDNKHARTMVMSLYNQPEQESLSVLANWMIVTNRSRLSDAFLYYIAGPSIHELTQQMENCDSRKSFDYALIQIRSEMLLEWLESWDSLDSEDKLLKNEITRFKKLLDMFNLRADLTKMMTLDIPSDLKNDILSIDKIKEKRLSLQSREIKDHPRLFSSTNNAVSKNEMKSLEEKKPSYN